MPPSSPSRRRGAPVGNFNGFKHGFNSTRTKKRDSSADDATILKSLADEIALIRLFTQRLVESCQPSADHSELTETLRILCLASTTITRILRVHYLITDTEEILDQDIKAAMLEANARLTAKSSSPSQPGSIQPNGSPPFPIEGGGPGPSLASATQPVGLSETSPTSIVSDVECSSSQEA